MRNDGTVSLPNWGIEVFDTSKKSCLSLTRLPGGGVISACRDWIVPFVLAKDEGHCPSDATKYTPSRCSMSTMFLKKCSALLCIVVLFPMTGCKGTTTVSGSASGTYNFSTGQGTATVTVGVTYQFPHSQAQAQAQAQDILGFDPASVQVGESIPSAFTLNNSPVQAILTGTTDTGYTSTITVMLQPTTPSSGPVNAGDVVYAWAIPSSADMTTWEQQLGANATSGVNVVAKIATPFTGSGTSGNFPISFLVTTSNNPTTIIASTTVIASGGLGGGGGKCPNRPGCPVQPLDPPGQ